MRTAATKLSFVLAATAVPALPSVYMGSAQAQSNVIVIVSDDAGYADFGFMDGLSGTTSVVPTPNLDALAGRGVTFSRAYVAQSCQPTRAALVTGGYQNRIGNEVVGNNIQGLPASATTIWDRMGSQGYTTGAVGKWHLGSVSGPSGNRPETQGVDEFYGIWHGSRTYNVGNTGLPQTQLLRESIVSGGGFTDTVVEAAHSGEYITNTFGQYAVDFIADHHDDADPFFLYQSFTAPHTPLGNSPDFNDPRLAGLSGIQKQYASMMLTMDTEIGRILDRLEDPDGNGDNSDSITDDTMIVFINDNGGAHAGSSSPNGADNGVLRAGKGSPYEGGIRVPMIIAGAGVSPSAEGTVYNKPVHGVDVLPTAFTAAGGSIGPATAGIDGVDLLPYINGSDTSDPHQVLVNRHRKNFTVIKGDWTLVNPGGSSTASHQLYNVATDISQNTNLAGANPAMVAELQRDLTDHEVQFDKQRYAILGQTDEATINTFDHFTFNPTVPGAGGEVVIIDGSLGDGDFEAAGGSGTKTYNDHPNWFHAGGSGGETNNFSDTTQMNGSSQSGSRGGLPFDNRVQINSTGYTITAAGEVFDVSYDFGAGGPAANWEDLETMRTFIFTSTTGSNINTVEGDMTILGMDEYDVILPSISQWNTHTGNAFYTTTAADIGKTVYFGMEFEDGGTGGSLFPRIDLIRLTSEGGAVTNVSTTNWSASGGWLEAGTNNVETMFNSDAFAGAVLEFPTTDTFSYISNNDLVRETGLEFMMNKMILSGSFNGAQDQNATIQGREVLFTNDLDGNGPEIAIDASNTGGNTYSYEIDLDVVMYNDVTITGNGDVAVNINGQVRDYFTSRGLTKTGNSTVALTGDNTYTGGTTVSEGTLLANNTSGSATGTGNVTVESGGTFGGTGSISGDVTINLGGTLSPGASAGRLTVGDVDLGDGTLAMEIGGLLAGSSFDELIADALTLGPNSILNVALINGFTPTEGSTYDLLDFSSITGTFGTINLPLLGGGLTWDTTNLLTTGVLVVSGDALEGDLDGDGFVGIVDLNLVLSIWNTDGSLDPRADVNGDGFVGIADLNAVLGNWNAGTPPGEALTAIPEPASLALLGVGATALLRRQA